MRASSTVGTAANRLCDGLRQASRAMAWGKGGDDDDCQFHDRGLHRVSRARSVAQQRGSTMWSGVGVPTIGVPSPAQ